MNKIYYTKPSITELEIRYATEAAATGWGERCYDYINRFEITFANRIGVAHTIATSSATGALHMGLAAAGIGPGDEVIVADINWIASVAPIVYLGAAPVFVDILRDSWCIDPRSVESAITNRTRAIIAVHLYGNLCNLSELSEIAKRHSLLLIEDAAEAIGSVYHGLSAGAFGDFSCFSFHGTKTITTGEGGLFATNNRELYDRVLALSLHGRRPGQTRQFWADEIGYKYRMSNIQAAIGCAQVERWDELVARKRQIFEWYKEDLTNLPITMNTEPEGTTNGYWMPTAVVDEGLHFNREELLKRFEQENIDGRVFFWPLSMLPMFEENSDNRVSYSTFPRAINLPSYHDIKREDVSRVSTVFSDFLTKKGGS